MKKQGNEDDRKEGVSQTRTPIQQPTLLKSTVYGTNMAFRVAYVTYAAYGMAAAVGGAAARGVGCLNPAAAAAV